ncbi:MAG: hypothetical protein JNL47_02875 [Bacteroidia bacterium]|nr:hypothetical protein [Bacteroidia bacterium]
MKSKFKFIVIALSVLFSSCAKDGEIGPQGPAGSKGDQGPQGVPGNANVKTVTVSTSNWTMFGTIGQPG